MKHQLRDQAIALTLTVLTCGAMVGILWLEIMLLNTFGSETIQLHVRPSDILVGMTIYLKTSIDFAIFIGRLMDKNPGLKGRIGIEIGTALGNAVGTFAILLLWAFFKEVNWLLAIMIVIAALVLIRLAQDSLEHVDTQRTSYPLWFRKLVRGFDAVLHVANKLFDPLLSRVLPSHSLKVETKSTLLGLLAVSFTVPFILGLDDFAGYVPLFNIVNVFGFAIGVFAGHMILNIFLYLSPKRTIQAVKNPLISLIGSIAFVILAGWGLIEAFKLLFLHHG
jgi:hypothetical protein